MTNRRMSRRRFLASASAANAVPHAIRSKALGGQRRPPPSQRIVMGSIGIGGRCIGQRVITSLLAGLCFLSGAGLSLATDAARGESAAQVASAAKPANSLRIPAYAYDRGNPKTIRLAMTDLMQTFGTRYHRGPEFLKRLDALEQRLEGPGRRRPSRRSRMRCGPSNARPCWPIRCWSSTDCS
ncbi:MAG: hypothetical protein ACC628_24610, partial [Pirellulaceae bacterium]